MLRRVLLVVLLFASVVLIAQAPPPAPQPPAPGNNMTQANFKSGGHISMDFGAGDFVVEGTSDEKITVTYTVDPGSEKNVSISLNTNNNEANLKVRGPSNHHFRVRVSMPSRTGLYLRCKVGDVTVRGLRGNKDVELGVGDLKIDVGSADEYAQADGSVRIGDLHATPWNIKKDGFGQSFRVTGPGRYTVHAHVGTGDLDLIGSAKAASKDPI